MKPNLKLSKPKYESSPIVRQGLEKLLAQVLDDIESAVEKDGELYQKHTRHYFDAINLAKKYCNPEVVEWYNKRYIMIINSRHKTDTMSNYSEDKHDF